MTDGDDKPSPSPSSPITLHFELSKRDEHKVRHLEIVRIPVTKPPPPISLRKTSTTSNSSGDGHRSDASTLWPADSIALMAKIDPNEPNERMWVLPWRPILEHLFPCSQGYSIHEYPAPTVRPRADRKEAVELRVAYRQGEIFQTVAFVQLNPPQRMDDAGSRLLEDERMRRRFVAMDRDGIHYADAMGISAFGSNIALYNSKHNGSVPPSKRDVDVANCELHSLDITPRRSMYAKDGLFSDASEMVYDECPRSFWRVHVLSDDGPATMVRLRDHVRDIVSKHLPPRVDPPKPRRPSREYRIPEFDPLWTNAAERCFGTISFRWVKHAGLTSLVTPMASMDPSEPHTRSWVLPWWPILAHLFPCANGYSIHEHPHPNPIRHKDKEQAVELMVAHRHGDSLRVVAFLQLHPPQRMTDRAGRIAADKKMRDRFISMYRHGLHGEPAVGISAIGGYISLYTSEHYDDDDVLSALPDDVYFALEDIDTAEEPLHYFKIKPRRIISEGGLHVDNEPDECPQSFWGSHVLSDHGYSLMGKFRAHVRVVVSDYRWRHTAHGLPICMPSPDCEQKSALRCA